MLKRLFNPSLPNEVMLQGQTYKIKHSLRKNMKRIILRVEKKNELLLSSSRISKKNLLQFIDESQTWIFEQEVRLDRLQKNGNIFYYLNKKYKILHHDKKLELQDEFVLLNLNNKKIQEDNFYKKQAKEYLPNRVEFWSLKMELEFNKLGFRLAKKRWGSCNSKKNISLNPYMMKLSLEMIDYIIVHELSHLVHLNHSKEFYKYIENYLPHYKTIEKEIKVFSIKSA